MEKKPLPEFRSPPVQIAELPGPAAYRQLHPVPPTPPPPSRKVRFYERRRVFIGFAIAVACHAAAGLAWWLSPALRLKVGYAPDRWVPVLSIPASGPQEPTPPTPQRDAAGKPRPPPP